MKLNRRTFLGWAAAVLPMSLLPRSWASDGGIRHILPMVTDSTMGLSVSVEPPTRSLSLLVAGRSVAGTRMDSRGRFWRFFVQGLNASTNYDLQLVADDKRLGQSWPLRTFPRPTDLPESFRLLAFTCAGGADGLGLPNKQAFKPLTFRHKLLEAGLAEKPDAAIAIGDHIYYDLKGGEVPAMGKGVVRYLIGRYFGWRYGELDRDKPIQGSRNEEVLIGVADEQIAQLYGTRFKSTPIFFVSDDHDYFENDDATEEIITFPADEFSRSAHKFVADLYYPAMPNAPKDDWGRYFGQLRYGQLFEGAVFDCAGHLSIGDDARLVPEEAEDWLLDHVNESKARHYALIPSHPMGWTAGKWREWYPDVVAPEGYTGIVVSDLMGDTKGALTTKAQKYLWQVGWWNQHQRLVDALSKRDGSRFTLSGDIHAQGAFNIRQSGELDFEQPIMSILVGPVSSSDITWPSSARGIPADQPESISGEVVAETQENNGFAIFTMTPGQASVRLFDCGGFDRSLEEDGSVVAVQELLL